MAVVPDPAELIRRCRTIEGEVCRSLRRAPSPLRWDPWGERIRCAPRAGGGTGRRVAPTRRLDRTARRSRGLGRDNACRPAQPCFLAVTPEVAARRAAAVSRNSVMTASSRSRSVSASMTLRATSARGGLNNSPRAEKTPLWGGMTTPAMSRLRARAVAWRPPAPPNATSVDSRGSDPCSSDTRRMAPAMISSTTATMPMAVPAASIPSSSPRLAKRRCAESRL